MQTILPLSDGSGLRLTTAKYYTPRGESIHSIGVKPDIVVEVKPTPRSSSVQGRAGKKSPSSDSSEKATQGKTSKGNKPDEDKTEEEREAELIKKDVQLQKAIELLTSWKVFKELRPL